MSGWAAPFAAAVERIDRASFEALNGLAGRFPLLDGMFSLALDSSAFKAGLIGACFVYAWFEGREREATVRARRILIATLVAALAVVTMTKLLSQGVVDPRPYVKAQKVAYLEGDTLVPGRTWSYRVPLEGQGAEKVEALKGGELGEGNLGAFPSDHAAFYIAIAVGIFMASRRAGAVALAWAVIVILGSRIVAGQHSPVQVAAGAAIGTAVLMLVQAAAERFGRGAFDAAAGLSLRYPGVAGAALFLAVFEIAETLEGVKQIAAFGAHAAGIA